MSVDALHADAPSELAFLANFPCPKISHFDEQNLRDQTIRYILLAKDLENFLAANNIRAAQKIACQILESEAVLFDTELNNESKQNIRSAAEEFDTNIDAVWDNIRHILEQWIDRGGINRDLIETLCGKNQLDLH